MKNDELTTLIKKSSNTELRTSGHRIPSIPIKMITEIKNNCMGTISFTAKFPRMRKAQDFIVYPISDLTIDPPETDRYLAIQSGTRFGHIEITTGNVTLSRPRASGSYEILLQLDITSRQAQRFILPTSDLEKLKDAIRKTASKAAGDNVLNVVCDNSGAAFV